MLMFVITIAGTGCTSNTEQLYELFLDEYKQVAENFKPDDFEEFGEGELKHSCVGFPENDFFPEENDMVDDNMSNPTKKNLFYRSKDKSIVIYITHMYSEEKLNTRLITSDVPQEESNEKGIGYFEEYYMTYGHTYADLKIFRLKETDGFHDTAIEVFQAYADALEVSE